MWVQASGGFGRVVLCTVLQVQYRTTVPSVIAPSFTVLLTYFMVLHEENNSRFCQKFSELISETLSFINFATKKNATHVFSRFSSNGFIFTMRPHLHFPSHTKAPLSATHLTNPTPPPPPRLCFRGDAMTPGLHPGDNPHPLPRRLALMSPTASRPSWGRGAVGKRATTGETLTVSVDVRWSVWWRLHVLLLLLVF